MTKFHQVTLAWTDPPSAIGSIAQLVCTTHVSSIIHSTYIYISAFINTQPKVNDISLTVTELATGNEYVPVEGDGINNIKQV